MFTDFKEFFFSKEQDLYNNASIKRKSNNKDSENSLKKLRPSSKNVTPSTSSRALKSVDTNVITTTEDGGNSLQSNRMCVISVNSNETSNITTQIIGLFMPINNCSREEPFMVVSMKRVISLVIKFAEHSETNNIRVAIEERMSHLSIDEWKTIVDWLLTNIGQTLLKKNWPAILSQYKLALENKIKIVNKGIMPDVTLEPKYKNVETFLKSEDQTVLVNVGRTIRESTKFVEQYCGTHYFYSMAGKAKPSGNVELKKTSTYMIKKVDEIKM